MPGTGFVYREGSQGRRGSMPPAGGANFPYDAGNHRGHIRGLVVVERPAGGPVPVGTEAPPLLKTVNRFSYDAMLRRTAVEDSAGVRYFTWDTNGMNLLAERDATGTVVAGYTHGRAAVDGIGSCVGQELVQSGQTYYEFDICDNRGSVVRRVNAAGQVTGYFEYDAWGNYLRDEETGASTRFRYQSNWIELKDDPDKALYLSPTRVYHARVGRFLGRDLLRKGNGGSERYEYVWGNPTVGSDPDGLSVKLDLPKTIAPMTYPTTPTWVAAYTKAPTLLGTVQLVGQCAVYDGLLPVYLQDRHYRYGFITVTARVKKVVGTLGPSPCMCDFSVGSLSLKTTVHVPGMGVGVLLPGGFIPYDIELPGYQGPWYLRYLLGLPPPMALSVPRETPTSLGMRAASELLTHLQVEDAAIHRLSASYAKVLADQKHCPYGTVRTEVPGIRRIVPRQPTALECESAAKHLTENLLERWVEKMSEIVAETHNQLDLQTFTRSTSARLGFPLVYWNAGASVLAWMDVSKMVEDWQCVDAPLERV